jgi:hypothetical protein
MTSPVLSLSYSLAKKGGDVNTRFGYANSALSQGIDARGVTANTWTEAGLDYNNAPALGSGAYSLALTTPGSTAISLASPESGAMH